MHLKKLPVIIMVVLAMVMSCTTAFAADGSITINHNAGGSVSAVNATNTSGNMILTTSDETIGITITPNEGYVIYGAYLNEVSMGISNSSEPRTVYISPRGENVVLRITFVKEDAANIIPTQPSTEEPSTPPVVVDPTPEPPPQPPIQDPEPTQPSPQPSTPSSTQPTKPATPSQPTTPSQPPQGNTGTTTTPDTKPSPEPSQSPQDDDKPTPDVTTPVEPDSPSEGENEASNDASAGQPSEDDIFGTTGYDNTDDIGDGVGNIVGPTQRSIDWAKVGMIAGIVIAVIASTAIVLVYIKRHYKKD